MLQNSQLLVNDPFVGKLYHFTINHASDLRLNTKRELFSQPSQNLYVIVTPGFDELAGTDSFSVKTL
jgi:hypothetical protein